MVAQSDDDRTPHTSHKAATPARPTMMAQVLAMYGLGPKDLAPPQPAPTHAGAPNAWDDNPVVKNMVERLEPDELDYVWTHRAMLRDGTFDQTRYMLGVVWRAYMAMPMAVRVVMGCLAILFAYFVLPFLLYSVIEISQSWIAMAKIILLLLFGGVVVILYWASGL